MEVLILTLFVSLMLAGAAIGFFVWSVKQGAHEHSDRLALLPIESDEQVDTPRGDEAEEKSSHESPERTATSG